MNTKKPKKPEKGSRQNIASFALDARVGRAERAAARGGNGACRQGQDQGMLMVRKQSAHQRALQATKATKKSKSSSKRARRNAADESAEAPYIEFEPLSEKDATWAAAADPQALFTKASEACQLGYTTPKCLALFITFTKRYPQFQEVSVTCDLALSTGHSLLGGVLLVN